ncbi:High osmolarity signaling protein SHO1 [Mycena venus]|uniref:High osmolarity signaling protein SHO1 n=1 Tax=Mycena venus TaxID=2733690 RepID=A0A8H6XQM6_9AGAR|nr:High osmolarity signaling protein SHO1 [Mycena venus]
MAANPTDALILWDPQLGALVKTEDTSTGGGRWAVILKALSSPSPGRTLDQVYSVLGKILEKQANHAAYTLGLGPHAVAQKITAYFGGGEERVLQLDNLRASVPVKLEKQCLTLAKYTLPTESVNVQRQAFKNILELMTLFPGLRRLFLHTKCLANATSIDNFSVLWERPAGSPDQEWTFWQTLAATCLTDTTISALLLIEHESSGATSYSRAICIRYLGGILDLPAFWSEMGTVHSDVAKKLCSEMMRVLKDIGVDILALGPIDESEPPFDYDGVDFLATTVLKGILSWFGRLEQENWPFQRWYKGFVELLQLLRRPRATELLPHSSVCATSIFENILPTAYQNVELNVFVDHDAASEIPHDNCDEAAADRPLDNNSTTSVHSTVLDRDDGHSVDSFTILDQDSEHSSPSLENSEARNHDSDEDSLQGPSQNETDHSSTSDQEIFIASQSDDAAHDTHKVQNFESGLETGQGTGSYQDLDLQNAEINRVAEGPIPTPTPYPSLEAQLKAVEELKIILADRQRDLGDDHPSTLQAMDKLAQKYYDLGKLRLARDLQVAVLQKQRTLLGDEHRDTLHSMRSLASTYYELSQLKAAQDLYIVVLEKHKQLLGEDHLETLVTMTTLAMTYARQGQLEEAENLHVVVLEKQRALFGEYHADTLKSMSALASVYYRQGQIKKAQEIDSIVLERRRQLGQDDPRTLWTIVRLGIIYFKKGQFKDAETMLVPALKKQRKILGEDHPDTLQTVGILAHTYHKLGQFKEAEELGVQAFEKQKHVLGEEHPNTLHTTSVLTQQYHNQGQFERAAELYVAIEEKRRKTLGDEHPDTQRAMHNLASTYRSLGKLQDAEELESLVRDQEL